MAAKLQCKQIAKSEEDLLQLPYILFWPISKLWYRVFILNKNYKTLRHQHKKLAKKQSVAQLKMQRHWASVE